MNPYLSIDTETSGLEAPKHQLLEVAVVIDDIDGDIEDALTFHRHIVPKDGLYHGDPFALALNASILMEHHQRDPRYQYCTREEFAAELASWLQEVGFDDQKFSVAGKNFGGFDAFFLRVHTLFFQTIKPVHRYLDMGNLFHHPEVDGPMLPDTEKCIERAGLAELYLACDGHHPYRKHRAVDDALMVCRMYRAHIEQRAEMLRRIGEAYEKDGIIDAEFAKIDPDGQG
jgi:hypothetical protein